MGVVANASSAGQKRTSSAYARKYFALVRRLPHLDVVLFCPGAAASEAASRNTVFLSVAGENAARNASAVAGISAVRTTDWHVGTADREGTELATSHR